MEDLSFFSMNYDSIGKKKVYTYIIYSSGDLQLEQITQGLLSIETNIAIREL